MSETIEVRPGDKIKRGAVVIYGDATIEVADKKTGPTANKAFECPKGCPPPSNPDGIPSKRRAKVFYIIANGDHCYGALLTPCYNCGETLVARPVKGKAASVPDDDIPF